MNWRPDTAKPLNELVEVLLRGAAIAEHGYAAVMRIAGFWIGDALKERYLRALDEL